MIDESNSLKMNLKVMKNQWEWAQRMNNIKQRATEIVCSELIYT